MNVQIHPKLILPFATLKEVWETYVQTIVEAGCEQTKIAPTAAWMMAAAALRENDLPAPHDALEQTCLRILECVAPELRTTSVAFVPTENPHIKEK